MITQDMIDTHFDSLASVLGSATVTDEKGHRLSLSKAYTEVINLMHKCNLKTRRIIFIGNGGSAAIASHMAEDYTKNGGMRAMTFNDASFLTCMANDYGYENMFSRALDCYADAGDILIAISSSGQSKNILNACKAASGLNVITLSGFSKDNPLRSCGEYNFYVPTKKGEYGFTEIAHLAILHSILDMICEKKK